MKDYDRQPVFLPRSIHQRLKTTAALKGESMTRIAAAAIKAALDGKQPEQQRHA